jgi:hypothetical protein
MSGFIDSHLGNEVNYNSGLYVWGTTEYELWLNEKEK